MVSFSLLLAVFQAQTLNPLTRYFEPHTLLDDINGTPPEGLGSADGSWRTGYWFRLER